MDMNSQTFKTLLGEGKEFQKLYEDHVKYEKQLGELDKIHYLTPEQEVQRKTIQKLKLNGKDQMSLLIRRAQAE